MNVELLYQYIGESFGIFEHAGGDSEPGRQAFAGRGGLVRGSGGTALPCRSQRRGKILPAGPVGRATGAGFRNHCSARHPHRTHAPGCAGTLERSGLFPGGRSSGRRGQGFGRRPCRSGPRAAGRRLGTLWRGAWRHSSSGAGPGRRIRRAFRRNQAAGGPGKSARPFGRSHSGRTDKPSGHRHHHLAGRFFAAQGPHPDFRQPRPGLCRTPGHTGGGNRPGKAVQLFLRF